MHGAWIASDLAIFHAIMHEKTFLLFIENEKPPALFGGNEQVRDVNTYHSV